MNKIKNTKNKYRVVDDLVPYPPDGDTSPYPPYPPAGQVPYPPDGDIGPYPPYPPAGQVPYPPDGDIGPYPPYPPAGQVPYPPDGDISPYPPYPPAGQVPYPPDGDIGPYPPAGQVDNTLKVSIKSISEDSYIVVANNGYLYTDYYNSDTFILYFLGYNKIKIQLLYGDFIRINSRGFLICDSNKENAAIFEVSKSSYMEYSLMTSTGYYIRVREKDKLLVASSTNPGPRTKFKFKKS